MNIDIFGVEAIRYDGQVVSFGPHGDGGVCRNLIVATKDGTVRIALFADSVHQLRIGFHPEPVADAPLVPVMLETADDDPMPHEHGNPVG